MGQENQNQSAELETPETQEQKRHEPALVQFIRRAEELGMPVNSTDIIMAYTLYPEYFDGEIKDMNARLKYITIDSFSEFIRKQIVLYEQYNQSLIPMHRKKYKIEQQMAIQRHNFKSQVELREGLKDLAKEYYPKPEIDEKTQAHIDEHSEHS